MLHRYENGWIQLETTEIGEDSENMKYTAETPGFSYFAITSEAIEEIEEPLSDGKVDKEGPAPYEETEEKQVTKQIPVGSFSFEQSVIQITAVVVLIIIVVVSLLFVRFNNKPKKRRRRKR